MAYNFGKIVLDSRQVFLSTKLSYCCVNLKPVQPGHVLVCPKRLVKRYGELTTEEITDLFVTVQKVAKVVEHEFNATSSTICIQDGPESGQTIEHVHVHVIPRKLNDFKNNDDVYREIDQHDKDDRKPRSIEQMETEAIRLRELCSEV